mgnify:CR=1 FL=1
MRYLLCVIISYLIGTFNPSYIVGVKKGINVKEKGSKNAGASNALILFGKVVGVVCALLDIGKACLAIALCRKIFSGLSYVFAIAGTSCIIGHIFPFYLKFKGGKGLACLGGVVLMFDFRYFLLLLAAELVIALATDYICFVPITASVIFPVSYGILRGDVIGALILGISAVVMLAKHIENIKRMRTGAEMRLSYLWNKDKELGRITQNLKDDE